jgi:group I intron endonuclease
LKYHCGIYKIENIITGDFYIGQSINLKKRKYQHFYELKRNKHYNKYLQYSYNKYENKNFEFSILLYCDANNLTFYEQLLVDNLNPTFNLCLECVDSIKGTKIKNQTLTRIKNIKQKKHLYNNYDESCLFYHGLPILFGKIPKILSRGRNIYKDSVFKKMFGVEIYPITLLMLYIYKNQMKNKKHSQIISKYLRKNKMTGFYTGIKKIVIETHFKDQYPDKLAKKVFHNIVVQENNDYISIYVNKKCFKHLYIIYF